MRNRARCLAALSAAALAAGCLAGPRLRRQRDWVGLHPEAHARIRRAVLAKELIEGMTVDAACASWGEPDEAVDLGGGVSRLTYNRRQDAGGVYVNVEYTLVFNRGVLIRIHQQKYR